MTSDSRQIRAHVRAALMIAVLVGGARAAIAFEVGWVMVAPFLAAMVIVTRLSPPIAALTMLFGWILLGQMDFKEDSFLPRMPTITVVTLWTIVWLIYWRLRGGSLHHLGRPVVTTRLILIALFLLLGVLNALRSGYLGTPVVLLYNWDVLRAWLGYLVIAILGCRDFRDLRVLLIGLPFAFLIYPLSLPLETWEQYFQYRVFSSNVLNVGLSYGSLNTNTLGQAAAVASLMAIAGAIASSTSRLRWCMFLLFSVAAGIVVMTASRQAVLSWLVGLFVMGIAAGARLAVPILSALCLVVVVGLQLIVSVMPEGSGLQTRLLDLTQPTESWRSGSATIREREIPEAIDVWLSAPLLGLGFGGQGYSSVHSLSTENTFALRGTHNMFLGILVQTGIAGLILFVAFAVGIIRPFLRITRHFQATYKREYQFARVSCISTLSCIFVQQNISGGLGVGSANLVFILGAMLGALGAIQAATVATQPNSVSLVPSREGFQTP